MENLKLHNQTKNLVLAEKVVIAKGLVQRMKGLLGRSSLPDNEVMWIKNCNSIHTWFMQFPIDVIFVNNQLEVKAIYKNLKPWKVTWPHFKATSVFEFCAGVIEENNLDIGDQLNVGH